MVGVKKERFTEKESCEFTKHPKLYKDTPWGYTKPHSEYDISDEIVTNRNNFPNMSFVTSFVSFPPEYIKEETYQSHGDNRNKIYIDHREIYKQYNGDHVAILSPYYNENNKQDIIDEAKKDGWEEIPKMYSKNALSFMKVILSPKRLKFSKKVDRAKRAYETMKKYIGMTFYKNEWEDMEHMLFGSDDYSVIDIETEHNADDGKETITLLNMFLMPK